jgi:hypothetical protein
MAHPNHSHILCGDFNKDIALIGRQNDSNITPPQTEDMKWRTFTYNLNLTYIPTNNTFTRQGGQNYAQTNLIDGYYIHTPNNILYTSTTKHDFNLNSDHSPVTLQIPPKTLLARPTQQKINKPPRILNSIPQENIEKLKILFFEENSLQINELTIILMNEHLSNNQWKISCTKLDHLIQQISDKTQETCSAPPLPSLTHRTTQQGGFLPRKLQKQWKKHMTTYHLIRKAIYITKAVPDWQNHPIMDELNNHNYITIPHHPTHIITHKNG